uniref:phosphatidylinositol N-acetylglucosaminyltransferase n=1 Tax=Parascaris univalens TaxID=6257 RepID=A0A914ZUQ3_PARUN
MSATKSSNRCERLCIALVSDFFCPNAGGVETHIYFLAHCLLQSGHKVIVITHAYGPRMGVRYLSNGLKVYYLPFVVAYNGCSLASITGSLYWYRRIFLREGVQLVHGHSTFSSMAHEGMFHGWSMGLRTVFTDHSLFGFADASAILTNKLVLQYSLANVSRVICVSYTSKENTVLRGGLAASKVSVIPNAINSDLFKPDSHLFYNNPTTVIVLSRLVYRKGADLLTKVIPHVCAAHPTVRFIIGGEGPKRVDVEEMRERHGLQERVIMLGTLPHTQVREVLVQGQIFLNTSLTEAFCMSIVEAASCGLHVVSTRVGGIPEVLPEEFIITSDPIPNKLVIALLKAIRMREHGELMAPDEKHRAVRQMYYWPDISTRTESVYVAAMNERPPSWCEGILRYYHNGLGFGILYIWVALINMIWLLILDYFDPRKDVEGCNDILKVKSSHKGNHVQRGCNFDHEEQ